MSSASADLSSAQLAKKVREHVLHFPCAPTSEVRAHLFCENMNAKAAEEEF